MRSSRVGKWANINPWEIPAASAIPAVVTAIKPRSANSDAAVSRIATLVAAFLADRSFTAFLLREL
jgi:hypothetical protein